MKSVLIVDDDEDILLGLRLLLEDTYRIVVAQDGLEALGRLEVGGIDLVVLDLMMPVMDGVGFMRELEVRGMMLPVIILSAHARLSERARELGAAGHLPKPFNVEMLERMIAQVLADWGPGGSDPSSPGGASGQGNGEHSSGWKMSRLMRRPLEQWEYLKHAWKGLRWA